MNWREETEWDGRTGGFTYKTSLLYHRAAAVCNRQPRFKQTPPFDSMLTWRHTIGMNPNIRLLQLTLYSSTQFLIKPKPCAEVNSRGGSWHVGRICLNFVKDSCLIAFAGACCPWIPPLLPVGPYVFHSVLMSTDAQWLCKCTVKAFLKSLQLADINTSMIATVNKNRHKSPQHKPWKQSTLIKLNASLEGSTFVSHC